MWTVANRLFALSLPLLAPDTGAPSGGEGNPPEAPTPPVKPEKPTFTAEQQQHLNNLLAAERKDAEERTALRIKAEADAKAEADREARERDEAASRGEFDKVRSELEAKASSAEQERDSLASEADALRSYFEAEYTAAINDLPDVITAFKPADDAPFTEKSAWLTKAKEQAQKVEKSQAPGNRPNPAAADGKFDLSAEVAKARASGKYRA